MNFPDVADLMWAAKQATAGERILGRPSSCSPKAVEPARVLPGSLKILFAAHVSTDVISGGAGASCDTYERTVTARALKAEIACDADSINAATKRIRELSLSIGSRKS